MSKGILALLLLAAPASAATYIVDVGGGEDATTLTGGLALAEAGDTVEVLDGHFYEAITVPPGVTLSALSNSVVRIMAPRWSAPAVVLSAGSTLDGVEVYGGSTGVYYAWSGEDDGATIVDSLIEGSYGDCVAVPFAFGNPGSLDFAIRRSELRDCAGDGVSMEFIGGSDAYEHQIEVRGVAVVGMGEQGLSVSLDSNHSASLDVRQNTFLGVGGAAVFLGGDWSQETALVQGNTVAECGSTWSSPGTPPTTGVSDNLVWQSGAADGLVAADTEGDPFLVAWSDDGNHLNDDFGLSCASLGVDLLPADEATNDTDGTLGDASAGGGPWALPRRVVWSSHSLSGGDWWFYSAPITLPAASEPKSNELLRASGLDATVCGRPDCEDVRLLETCSDPAAEVDRTVRVHDDDTFTVHFAARTRNASTYCNYEVVYGNPQAGAPDQCRRILLDDDFEDDQITSDPEWTATHPSSWDVQPKDGHGAALYGPNVDTGSDATFITWYEPTQIGGGRGLYTRFSEWCGGDYLYGVGHETDLASGLSGVEGGGLRFTAKGAGTGAYPGLTGAGGDVLDAVGFPYCGEEWKDWSVSWDPATLEIEVQRDGAVVTTATDTVGRFVVEGTGISHINTGYWYDDVQVATFPFQVYADSHSVVAAAALPLYGGNDHDEDGLDASVDCHDEDPSLDAYRIDVACDGVDIGCDGLEEAEDYDGDGAISARCEGGTDCDDTRSDVGPHRTEVCEGRDTDCDPSTSPGDEDDSDGDGSLGCAGDCDDEDPDVHPGAPDLCGDGVDSNCANGYPGPADDEYDDDADGYWTCDDDPDCDDNDATRRPGAEEVCDGVDTNCDGQLLEGGEEDQDGDGSPVCEDCDDEDSRRSPRFEDACDTRDDDCDGDAVEEYGDLDGDGVPDCVDFDQPPGLGVDLNCSVAGGGGAWWLLLLVPLVGRRRGAWTVVALLLASSAAAATPEEVAAKAGEVHAEACVRGVDRDLASAVAMHDQVSGVLGEVDAAYKETGQAWLLYWRALLALCLDEGGLAEADLQAFLGELGEDPGFASLADDARRRLRRMQRLAPTRPGRASAATRLDRRGRPYAPFVLGVGLGFGILDSPAWRMPGPGLDVIGRLYGPLGLMGQARFLLSQDIETHDGSHRSEAQGVLLPVLAVGLSLRWPTVVTPVFAVLFQLAPTPINDSGDPALMGPRFHVGAEIGLGPHARVALRPGAEWGVLGPHPHVSGRLAVVFRFGPRPGRPG